MAGRATVFRATAGVIYYAPEDTHISYIVGAGLAPALFTTDQPALAATFCT